MAGIAAAGCYIPMTRLPLSVLTGCAPREGDPERSVAWFDEDSITMGVAAARDCLVGRERGQIDLLLFATTTYAFEEKQGGVIVARALGLSPSVRTVDIGHSLRGGTQALALALDAVAAGSARQALVVVADCRMGPPGSELEKNSGDAAAAFLVKNDGALALFVGGTHCSEEIVDVWRSAGDRFTHQWEERFVQQHGYLAPAIAAAGDLRQKFSSLEPKVSQSPWTWILSASDEKSHRTLATRLQLDRSLLRNPLFGQVGYCGAAHAPLQLVEALDTALPGQRVAMVNHGDGAEALLFEISGGESGLGDEKGSAHTYDGSRPALVRDGRVALARRRVMHSLDQFRRVRDLNLTEYPAVYDQGISATVHFRERDENLSLAGQRCECGEPQFPKGRICGKCQRKDRWRSEGFAERHGRLVTYTLDAFHPSPHPPTAVGIVQIDNGPRVHMQIADTAAQDVDVGLSVRFVFRRIHQVGRRPNYFWKAAPLDAAAPGASANLPPPTSRPTLKSAPEPQA